MKTQTLNLAIATCVLCAAAAMFHSTARAQAKTVADGVYTDAQAARGATLYAEQCASCHGEDLSGVAGLFPPLAGDDFVKTWTDRPLGELFDKIATTMPALDPGSLKPEQVADVTAYMLKAAKYPAGTTELAASAEPLNQVKIVAPK